MSRSTYAPKQTYLGTGALAEYTFDFKIELPTYLLIIEVDDLGNETQRVRGDDLVYLSSLEYDPIDGGGTVTLAANLPAGYNLILLLANDAPTQDYEFRNKTSFTLRRFENALDLIMGPIQRLTFRAKQAFRIHDLDDEDAFDTQLPAGIADQASRVFQVNDTGDGFEFGPLTTEIANAQGYAEAAAQSAVESAASAEESEASAVISEEAANEAQYLLFDGNANVNDTQSPLALTQAAYANKIISINAENGNVVINLDPIASYESTFKAQFIRTDDSVNTVTIVPNGAETIDSEATYVLVKGLAVILSIDSATDWQKKFIGLANGGSVLPDSGVTGDYLEYSGTDPIWQSGVFAGFSAFLNRTIDVTGLRNLLLEVLDFSYLAPQVSLSASGSGTIREKGTVVASTTLTATTTKRTDNIATLEFREGTTQLELQDPAEDPTGGSSQHIYSTPFSDNISFNARATDDGTSGGPTVVTSNTVSFTFVYPYYSGAGVPALTAAQVAALTKDVRVSTASLNKTFTTANDDVYYFAYPASYGALTSILDENGFETFGDWTLRTENITGLDTTAQSYRIYEFNNPVVAGSTNYTFIR